MASGKKTSDLDGILIRLCSAIGKKERIDVAGCNFRELSTQPGAWFRSHERVGVRQCGGLLLDRFDDPWIAVSDVDAHQLAVEIDETLTLGCPEVNSLGLCHR